jgi:hypothetical protein
MIGYMMSQGSTDVSDFPINGKCSVALNSPDDLEQC